MAGNNTLQLIKSKAIGAMLGAAFGDALGWPNERIAKSNALTQTKGPSYDFKRWIRHSGGRFYPHKETIEKGEYSDDTQLILCLSRSLQRGESWWNHFTEVELPFWSVYERGGGGATKRAADSWLSHIEPWSPSRKPQDVRRYYNAGGNGVAMRILPHVLHGYDQKFPEIAINIFRDGIATHGHPRALLGALAYGFALWVTLHKYSKLDYGGLLEELIKEKNTWSTLPTSLPIPPKWKTQAEANLQDYTKLWESAKAEIMKYLEVCQNEFSKGGISLDEDALKKLQCFDSKIKGAGTVAAIASVYLASRHAADPINGVINAAFAIGSDTDTIASMTGGLLGCIHGPDWLPLGNQDIQDTDYIEQNAIRLATGHIDNRPPHKVLKRSSLKSWTDNALDTPCSGDIDLPDHRKAKVVHHDCGEIKRNRARFKVEFRRLKTEDNQTIYLKKISKDNSGSIASNLRQQSLLDQQILPKCHGCDSKIPVASFDEAISFYGDCLGLTIKKKKPEMVEFDQGPILVPSSYMNDFPQEMRIQALLCIQAANIDKCFQQVKKNNLKILTKLTPWKNTGTPFFRVLDPDENVVEVFAADR